MKITLGLICIMLALLVSLQSCAITATSALVQDEMSFGAGSAGVFTAILVFVAGAFAFGLPKVSVTPLIVAGLLAALAASDIPDMAIWSALIFALAVLGIFAARKDSRAARATKSGPPKHSQANQPR